MTASSRTRFVWYQRLIGLDPSYSFLMSCMMVAPVCIESIFKAYNCMRPLLGIARSNSVSCFGVAVSRGREAAVAFEDIILIPDDMLTRIGDKGQCSMVYVRNEIKTLKKCSWGPLHMATVYYNTLVNKKLWCKYRQLYILVLERTCEKGPRFGVSVMLKFAQRDMSRSGLLVCHGSTASCQIPTYSNRTGFAPD